MPFVEKRFAKALWIGLAVAREDQGERAGFRTNNVRGKDLNLFASDGTEPFHPLFGRHNNVSP